MLGPVVKNVARWSPIGTTKLLLLAAMSPTGLDLHAAMALVATLGYGLLFATIGVRSFKWSVA